MAKETDLKVTTTHLNGTCPDIQLGCEMKWFHRNHDAIL